MVEPLSISAAIVGITVPALHGARRLLDDLEKINNAPEAVARLGEEVTSISTNLTLLKDIEDSVWATLGTAVCDQSKATVESCETACDTIRADIQRWTKRSKGGKLSWRDRVNVGFLRDRQLKAHYDRMRTYRLGLNSTVGTATLYSSVHNSRMTEEIRNAVLSHQSQIASASSSAQAEVAVVERALAEIQSYPNANPAADEGDEEGKEELQSTVTNLEDLMQALRLCQTLLRELSSRSQTAEVAKGPKDGGTTNNTFGYNNKGMQIGTNHGSITWNGSP